MEQDHCTLIAVKRYRDPHGLVDGIIFYCDLVYGHHYVRTKYISIQDVVLRCGRFAGRASATQREPLTRSPAKTRSRVRFDGCSSRTWLVHCGDQIGPVDIRGARPLHSGCCEAVLECAPHAVDSRIFGSTTVIEKSTFFNLAAF